MRLLLDTATFLWLVAGSPRLSMTARESIRDPAHDVFLSAVSAWEIAVKHGLGKLPLPDAPERWIPKQRLAHGVDILTLTEDAALTITKLPAIHRDPFDRMLVSQALHDGLILVTADEDVRAYPVRTLW